MFSDSGDGVLVPVGERHAVAILPSGDVDLSEIGVVRGVVDAAALAKLATAVKVIGEGASLPARMAGRLVELDAQSVVLLRQARQTVEAGGWVQGTLRVDGKFAHVARFRPAAALDVAAGFANLVGAVAAQAQLAAIHRDVLRTLREVQNGQAFQHAELTGNITSDVEDVSSCIALMLDVGLSRRAMDTADRAGERLRRHRAHCLILANTAVDSLTAAAGAGTPTAAAKTLRSTTADHARQYLELAAAAHLAAVEAEALTAAELLAVGDPAGEAHAKALGERAQREQARLEELRRRAAVARRAIEGSFASTTEHFKRAARKVILPGGAVSGVIAAAATTTVGVAGVAVTAGGVRIAAQRNTNAERSLRPMLDDLLAADENLAAAIAHGIRLVDLIRGGAELASDPPILPSASNSPRLDPELTERVLAALLQINSWADLPEVNRKCNVPPPVLRAALQAAADEGLVNTRPSPARTPNKVLAVTQYRMARVS